jgi:hypothetical protein
MDDMAPAPTQRTSDDVGQTREMSFAARKKATKKMKPAPVKNPSPEAENGPEPEPEHQVDLLA